MFLLIYRHHFFGDSKKSTHLVDITADRIIRKFCTFIS